MESKKVLLFNKLSFVALLGTLFLCLFFFVPYNPITLEAGKGFIFSVGVTLSLFFWLISRLGDGRFLIPKDKLILFVMIIPLVFLISSLFSFSLHNSLFGSSFEVGTFGSMLICSLVFFLSAIHFQKEKRVWYFLGSLFLGALIIVIFQLLNLFINLNTIFPRFLQGISLGNLIGNLNNLALFFGVIVLLSLFTIELLKTKISFKIFQFILLIVGLILLIIIGTPLVWSLVGVFSVIIFVYSLSIQHSGVKIIRSEVNKKRFPFTSFIVILISLVAIIGNSMIDNFLIDRINLNNLDIRPSVVATSRIALKSITRNPFLGTGPNTFTIDWSLWQPKEVSQTIFWNADFDNGFSLFLTIIVTTGLLGLVSFLLFLITYIVRGIQSIRIALQNTTSNYFVMTLLMISIYSWVAVILYNPNIIILMLAFSSSGVLVGVLVSRQAIRVREYSFLSDPRHSFFSILGLLVLMACSISLTYIFIEKFTSIIYFSKSLNDGTTVELLNSSEKKLLRAISLDKNDVYYRNLSQIYLNKINLTISDKDISKDELKSKLQQLINLSQTSAEQAVNQNPKQYLNYMNLGNVYGSFIPFSVVNSYESAVFAYNKAVELAPNNPSVLLARASVEFINKNNSEARKYIKQALNLKANYTDAVFLLVQIETNEGNLFEAIKQAEYAGEIAPNDPTVFFRLGLLRYNNNDYRGAVDAFEKAVYLNNNYLNAHYFLGQSYKKLGRINDAMAQFNLLSKVLPDNQEIKDAISSINSPNTENINTQIIPENKTDTQKMKLPLKEKQ